MKKVFINSTFAMTLLSSTIVFADVLTLKDGQTITGTLLSRDANGVVFDVSGQKLTFKNDNVAGVTFGNNNEPKTIEEKTVKSESTEKTSAQKNIGDENTAKVAPVGTRVVARTNTSINSSQHKTGHKFNARLEADMVVDGVVIAPRGTTLYGVISSAKKSGRLAGKSELQITFTDIMVNNQMLPISTSSVKAVTEGTAKNTVGTTARTAAIGGLINGSKGAKDGAKVGLGLSVLSRGNSINIPAGTMLEFQLATPLTIK